MTVSTTAAAMSRGRTTELPSRRQIHRVGNRAVLAPVAHEDRDANGAASASAAMPPSFAPAKPRTAGRVTARSNRATWHPVSTPTATGPSGGSNASAGPRIARTNASATRPAAHPAPSTTRPAKSAPRSRRRTALNLTGVVAAAVTVATAATGSVHLPAEAAAPEELTLAAEDEIVEYAPVQIQVLAAGIDLSGATETIDNVTARRAGAASRSFERSDLPGADAGFDEFESAPLDALAAAPAIVAADLGEPELVANNVEIPSAEVFDTATKQVAAVDALADAGVVLTNEAIGTPESNTEIREAAERVAELTEALAAEPEAGTEQVADVAADLAEATAELEELLDAVEITPVVIEPAPMTAHDHLMAQAMEAQADRHRLASFAGSVSHFPNGRIPASAMQSLSWAPGHRLRTDAATQFERLNIAFREQFGVNLSITDSYRSFENQVRVRAARPHLAAVPGTSFHGLGIAVDLGGGVQRFGSPEHQWLRQNAPLFGWILPGWAQEGGRKPEPWHWEFHPEQMRLLG